MLWPAAEAKELEQECQGDADLFAIGKDDLILPAGA